MEQRNWTVVVPVKRLDAAKSRLRGVPGTVPHARLALALAYDTVTAAMACPEVAEVLVVTEDAAAGAELRTLGARVVPDPPGGGLNPAFACGAALARSRWVAALTADLPALRPGDLAGALRAAGRVPGTRWYVADAPGTGTVLLTATEVDLDPRFGPDSAAAHAVSGAGPLGCGWPSLRRDVDTPTDLAEARELGLGRHTAALVPPDRTTRQTGLTTADSRYRSPACRAGR